MTLSQMMLDQGLHKRNIRDQTTIMGNSHWKQKHILICTKQSSQNISDTYSIGIFLDPLEMVHNGFYCFDTNAQNLYVLKIHLNLFEISNRVLKF